MQYTSEINNDQTSIPLGTTFNSAWHRNEEQAHVTINNRF